MSTKHHQGGRQSSSHSSVRTSIKLVSNVYKVSQDLRNCMSFTVILFDAQQNAQPEISYDTLSHLVISKTDKILEKLKCSSIDLTSNILVATDCSRPKEEFLIETTKDEEDLYDVKYLYFSQNENISRDFSKKTIIRGALRKIMRNLKFLRYNNMYFSWTESTSLKGFESVLKPSYSVSIFPVQEGELGLQVLHRHLVFPELNLAMYIEFLETKKDTQETLPKMVENHFLNRPIFLTHRSGLHSITSFEWPYSKNHNKIYEEIDRNGTPKTYRDYYYEKYKVKLEEKKTVGMPFVIHNDKKGMIHKFPACLCVPKGYDIRDLTSQSRQLSLKKEVTNHTIMPINKRFSKQDQYVNQLNTFASQPMGNFDGIDIDKKPVSVEGFQYNTGIFQLSIGKTTQSLNQYGNFRVESLNTPTQAFTQWALIMPKIPEKFRSKILSLLKISIQNLKLGYNEPIIITSSNYDIQDLKKKKVLCIMMITSSNNDYLEFKKNSFFQGIPSQVVKLSNFDLPDKKRDTILKNVIIQLQVKTGAIPWAPKTAILENQYIIIGISDQKHKSKENRLISLFADMGHQNSASFYSKSVVCPASSANEELISFTNECQKAYRRKHGKAPDLIIYYKLTSINNDMERILNEEVDPLELAIKSNSRSIKLLIIYAIRDGKMRFAHASGSQSLSNPPPMTIIDNFGLSEKTPQFYCLHQSVSPNATAAATLYHILKNDLKSKDSLQKIYQFTMMSSCLYFNWQGAIPLPAPLKYADKNLQWTSEILSGEASSEASPSMSKTLYML